MSVTGVLVLDKPSGMTSHDVVARVRRVLQTRRVGHAGTLDPDATGVLVVCIGQATRLVEYVSADDKTYQGTVVFGVATDTDDAAGQVVSTLSAASLDEMQVQAAGQSMVGRQAQRAPRVSAIHIDGQRAHALARSGASFELPVRDIEVYSLTLSRFCPGEQAVGHFVASCSKGTYIRSLCRDWGANLGIPAHMGTLRRLQSGRFSVEQAWTLSQWEDMEQPEQALLPLEAAVSHVPTVTIDEEQCRRLSFGQTVATERATAELDGLSGLAKACDADGRLVAMVEVKPKSACAELVPNKVFWKKD